MMSTWPPRQPVVVVDDLQKRFGDVVAVDDLSFEVAAGQVLGLLGPNGAGKTTTIRMLATLTRIDGGRATVAGLDVAAQPGLVRKVIGLAGQSAAVDELLTARENLDLFARLYHIPRGKRGVRVRELVDLLDLGDFADRPASTLSGGQRRRLDIAASIVASPAVLFLDEPTTGLDPGSRASLWSEITRLARNGTTILLTTQYLDEADRLADQIVVIDHGRVAGSGTPTQLKRRVGQDVLEVSVASRSDRDRAAALFGSRELTVGDETTVHLPVVNATDSISLVRQIEDAGIRIADFQLRRPTLDDVYLTLTRAAVDHSGGEAA